MAPKSCVLVICLLLVCAGVHSRTTRSWKCIQGCRAVESKCHLVRNCACMLHNRKHEFIQSYRALEILDLTRFLYMCMLQNRKQEFMQSYRALEILDLCQFNFNSASCLEKCDPECDPETNPCDLKCNEKCYPNMSCRNRCMI